MKYSHLSHLILGRAVPVTVLAILLALPGISRAYTNTFESAEDISGWVKWWGGTTPTFQFDGNKDADGNGDSGALMITVPYSKDLGGDNQFSIWGSFSGTPNSWGVPLNGTLYTNLEMDIYWDPSSPQAPNGTYGGDFRYGFAVGAPNYSQISFDNHTTLTTNDAGRWIHLSAPIDLTTITPTITNIVGIWLKMWSGGEPNGLQGNAVFWVDNIRLNARATNAPADPPPSMAIEKATPGLRLYASAPGAQYQRQGIRTVTPSYSWVGAGDPVTYSITITDHPKTSGFQTHIFLIPGNAIATTDNSPDYGQPNAVFLDIGGNATSGWATFRYKTNEPNGNTFLYNTGSIASVGSSTVIGTWNLTFNPSGDISLTSPSGGSTNFTMPTAAVALFNGPLYAYFGIQPNNPANYGLGATLGRVQIGGGVATPIDDDFSSGLLNPAFEVVAQHPGGVIPVASDALLWLTWSLPDLGYSAEVTDTVTGPWGQLSVPAVQMFARKRALVRWVDAPGNVTGNYFFRLVKPAAP
jgi:hypothetical protein